MQSVINGPVPGAAAEISAERVMVAWSLFRAILLCHHARNKAWRAVAALRSAEFGHRKLRVLFPLKSLHREDLGVRRSGKWNQAAIYSAVGGSGACRTHEKDRACAAFPFGATFFRSG